MFLKPECASKMHDNETLLLSLLVGVESEQVGQHYPLERNYERFGSLKVQPMDESA